MQNQKKNKNLIIISVQVYKMYSPQMKNKNPVQKWIGLTLMEIKWNHEKNAFVFYSLHINFISPPQCKRIRDATSICARKTFSKKCPTGERFNFWYIFGAQNFTQARGKLLLKIVFQFFPSAFRTFSVLSVFSLVIFPLTRARKNLHKVLSNQNDMCQRQFNFGASYLSGYFINIVFQLFWRYGLEPQ